MKRVFMGGKISTQSLFEETLGDQRPLDNILKKLTQGYQLCCFPWSNRYKFFLQLFSNVKLVLFSWTDVIALFIKLCTSLEALKIFLKLQQLIEHVWDTGAYHVDFLFSPNNLEGKISVIQMSTLKLLEIK